MQSPARSLPVPQALLHQVDTQQKPAEGFKGAAWLSDGEGSGPILWDSQEPASTQGEVLEVADFTPVGEVLLLKTGSVAGVLLNLVWCPPTGESLSQKEPRILDC